jgi:CRP-like cAMP-binding protein
MAKLLPVFIGEAMPFQQMPAGIPENELKQFVKFVHVGKTGDHIITEGEQNDTSLYLLRVGKIGVSRNIGGILEKISEFKANAFFGEMELMEDVGVRGLLLL